MAKRNRSSGTARTEARLKEGRGQGRGVDYGPWLRIQDVPSHGLVSRVKGWKTNREHHLMSNLETGYFYILEWSQSIIDIREQYPLLPLEETQEIAEQCGFPHPTDPVTKQPIVMTTDFLINLKCKDREIEHARAIKPASELQSQRTLEKLEIERLYWKRREVDWGIVTEKEIPKTLVENLKWIHLFYKQEELEPLNQADITRIDRLLRPKIAEEKLPLTDITNACDDRLGLQPGTSLSVVRYLVANRYWLVNMNQPIQPSKVLRLLPNQAVEDCQKSGELA